MIRTCRMYEFVTEIVNLRKEELEEKASWEFWLHKDFERSYSEFRDSISTDNEEISEEKLTEIVKQSYEIASFVPPEEE